MTELQKLNRSMQRVIKAFKGIYRLKDILDSVLELKDTFNKTISGKFAGIDVKDHVLHLVSKIKSVQFDLNDLPIVMKYERGARDKNSTLIELTTLKSELLEIKELSLSLPVEINRKSGGLFVLLRTRIDSVVKDVQKYINEVRAWKYG